MEKIIEMLLEAVKEEGPTINELVSSLDKNIQEELVRLNGNEQILVALGCLSQYDEIRIDILRKSSIEVVSAIKASDYLLSDEEINMIESRLRS